MNNILKKIKQANLSGRGGACFPVNVKWEMVKQAGGREKYVVCNGSEGEPGVKKDGYILSKNPEQVINGMKIAINFLHAKKGYLYLNPNFYHKYKKHLFEIINGFPIEIIKKPHTAGYIGGEESSMLNAIEGKIVNPRLRPPFPTTSGLWGEPTLVNNIETFSDVSLIAADEYEGKRYFTIHGDVIHVGVYNFDENLSIEKILKETGNYPKFNFFVQIGGDASGEVLNKGQLKRKVGGAGSINVYSLLKHSPLELLKNWLEFFAKESCGQCTPCREGTYRLNEIINSENPDWKMFGLILDNLDETSFCGLGCSVSVPIRSFVKNVLSKYPKTKINIGNYNKKKFCECF